MSHVSRGGEELGTVFARFIKERAELEREHAKNMRKLVNKYTDKTAESKKSKETTQAKGFRWGSGDETWICLLFIMSSPPKEMVHVMSCF